MTRRKKRIVHPAEARRFAISTVHAEATNLLRLVEEICQLYPPGDELHFVRYLLRMVVLETERDVSEDSG